MPAGSRPAEEIPLGHSRLGGANKRGPTGNILKQTRPAQPPGEHVGCSPTLMQAHNTQANRRHNAGKDGCRCLRVDAVRVVAQVDGDGPGLCVAVAVCGSLLYAHAMQIA